MEIKDTHQNLHTVFMKLPTALKDFTPQDKENLTLAANKIKNGELVAFPTETVYGLGGNGLDPEAAKRIYAAKGRPSDNPLILHFSDIPMVEKYLGKLPTMATKLLTAYAPGPLTVVVPKSEIIPYTVTGGLETVAIRIPDDEVTRELIAQAGVPIAGPSANTSGKPSPTTGQMVYDDLKNKIHMVLETGFCQVGLESTIVDCTGEAPIILRPGAITKEMLQEIFPVVHMDAALADPSAKPKAPGMKYKHYAPDAPMVLLMGQAQNMATFIKNELATKPGEQLGLFISQEVVQLLHSDENFNAENVIIYNFGSRKDLKTVATKIYAGLRYFNDFKVNRIYGEGFPEEDLGVAMMNRLKKAAAGNIVYLDD